MASPKYKTTGSLSLFDVQETYQKLSAIGNPLEKIFNVVNFEMFRETLEAGLLNKNKKNNARVILYTPFFVPQFSFS